MKICGVMGGSRSGHGFVVARGNSRERLTHPFVGGVELFRCFGFPMYEYARGL